MPFFRVALKYQEFLEDAPREIQEIAKLQEHLAKSLTKLNELEAREKKLSKEIEEITGMNPKASFGNSSGASPGELNPERLNYFFTTKRGP